MAVLGAQRWTGAEVAHVSRKLGRSADAIRIRVRRFRGRVRRRWTPEEDALLMAIKLTPHTERFVGGGAFADIAARLGVTEIAARSRYDQLKRKAGHHGGQWTDDGLWTEYEDAVIRAQIVYPRAPAGTWDVIADRLGRTPGAVRTRACKLRRGLDGTARSG